jgi:hypothetical protein
MLALMNEELGSGVDVPAAADATLSCSQMRRNAEVLVELVVDAHGHVVSARSLIAAFAMGSRKLPFARLATITLPLLAGRPSCSRADAMVSCVPPALVVLAGYLYARPWSPVEPPRRIC